MDSISLNNRKGKLTFSTSMLYEIDKVKVEMLEVFKSFIPISTDYSRSAINQQVDFYGYCEHFREVQEGEIPPSYNIVVHYKEDQTIDRVEFEEIVDGDYKKS